MAARLCAVSIDLDEIRAYRAIHGLAERSVGSGAVYLRALGRIAGLSRGRALPLTLFVVGVDLEQPGNGERLMALVRAGAELENHSHHHRYALARLPEADMRREVRRAQEIIGGLTGRAPKCFRAPGYGLSDRLLDVLVAEALPYDSSALPSPPYYLAKLAALSAVRLAGRRSAAVLGAPAGTWAPAEPYRPGRPWWRRGGRRLLELPIAVGRVLRLPVIGTALTLAGPAGARVLARSVVGRPLVNLELHGIDFLDAGDGIEDLVRHQPALRVPLGRKLASLAAALDVLAAAGYRFTTLARAAAEMEHSV